MNTLKGQLIIQFLLLLCIQLLNHKLSSEHSNKSRQYTKSLYLRTYIVEWRAICAKRHYLHTRTAFIYHIILPSSFKSY